MHARLPAAVLPALGRSQAVGAAEGGLCVGGRPPPASAPWAEVGLPLGRLRRCAAGGRPRTRASSAPARPLLLAHRCVSVLSGTCVRVAERADGVGVTPHVAGVGAAAFAAAADLSAGQRGRPRRSRGCARSACGDRWTINIWCCARGGRGVPREARWRVRAGRGWPGGTPRSPRSRPEPRRRLSRAAVVAAACMV